MKFLPLFLCVFLLAFQSHTMAQVGVSYPMDGIYVKEHVRPEPLVQLHTNSFLVIYSLPQLLDTLQVKAAVAKIKTEFPKQPLKINDCVYFDAFLQNKSTAGGFSSKRFFNSDLLPPSLRFSTYIAQNYVDEFFNLHLFPNMQPENYLQPFYFKKTEVTNAEYREFVNYVLDSVTRRILIQGGYEDVYRRPESELEKEGYEFQKYGEVYWPLNMKEKIQWDSKDDDYRAALQYIYLPMYERFYNRKEIDVRKLNYVYFTEEPQQGPGMFKKTELNIYPDTMCWLRDFDLVGMENMSNLYFWHPAYNNYPVVGISFEQAKAYLNWKTKTEQQKLNARGEKFIVQYDLPAETEWEIAATSERKAEKIVSYTGRFPALADQSWLTDLVVDSATLVNEKVKVIHDTSVFEVPDAILLEGPRNLYIGVKDSVYEKDGKRINQSVSWYYWIKPRAPFAGDAQTVHSLDERPFTAPANLELLPKTEKKVSISSANGKSTETEYVLDNTVLLTQLDANKISFMGGNVSEWIDQEYSFWLPAFETRLKMLHAVHTPDAETEYQRELYFNTFNARNGKLVRGANWYDERYGNFLDKNPAGTNAKVFVDPAKQRCTIGFRYVVRVKRK